MYIVQDSYKRGGQSDPDSQEPGRKPKLTGGKVNGALLVDPDNVARPDFSQMVPFKPKVIAVCFCW